MKPILHFDDPGAGDDHPARGVTVGDIRAWYDEMERLRAALWEIASLPGERCDEAPSVARRALTDGRRTDQ